MNRLLLTLLVFFVVIGCKTEKKKLPEKIEPEISEKIDSKVYPVLKPYSSEMNIIYDKGYLFDEKIQLDEISVENIGKDLYDVVMYFNESTDFEMLEEYKISLTLYPKNPNELSLEKDRIAKRKKNGAKAEVKMLDKAHVVVMDSIKVLPKEFSKIKIHMYGNNIQGALNDNFLILRDVDFN